MSIKRRFFGLLALGWAIALLLSLPAATAAQTPPTELRGVWLTNIDSEVLFSRYNLTAGLVRLKRLNFNTVYPTVWNGGYTLFPSETAKRTFGKELDPYPGLQGRDLLAEITFTGHRLGLSVIPWFEFGMMAPANSELARQHPDWLTARQDGTQIWMQGNLPRVWLNPAHPDVQQFMVDLITEAVRKYDIDGIQLDDHFGMSVDFGYDPYTVQRYKETHNSSEPPANSEDPEWVRWRADNLSRLMKKLVDRIKAIKPNCVISLSPNPRDFAYQRYLQDWGAWERRGLVEELIVQVYRDDFSRFLWEIGQPVVQTAKDYLPVGIGLLSGLKNRITDMEKLQQQVTAVREKGYAGVSFFFYETIGKRDAAFKALFPTPAQRPVYRPPGFLTAGVEQ